MRSRVDRCFTWNTRTRCPMPCTTSHPGALAQGATVAARLNPVSASAEAAWGTSRVPSISSHEEFAIDRRPERPRVHSRVPPDYPFALFPGYLTAIVNLLRERTTHHRIGQLHNRHRLTRVRRRSILSTFEAILLTSEASLLLCNSAGMRDVRRPTSLRSEYVPAVCPAEIRPPGVGVVQECPPAIGGEV
jgi:hypothetical protein